MRRGHNPGATGRHRRGTRDIAPALTDGARCHWNSNFDLTTAPSKTGFPVSEGIQRGFYSDAQNEIVFRRNERALQHYHRAIKSALLKGVHTCRPE